MRGVFIKKEYFIYIAVAIVIVIGIAAYFIINNGGAKSGCPLCGTQVSQSYLEQLSQVANNNTLADSVGPGIVVSGPYANLPKAVNGQPFTINGKPGILYVGGDFCPYCAVSRWGLIIALMRFGNFTSLSYMESSPSDVYASTPTFSFTNATYNSNLVGFAGFELLNRDEQNVSNPGFDSEYQNIYSTYSSAGIPFVDIANASVVNGASVTPQVLDGSNWNQILVNITKPNSLQAQGVIGDADVFTAYICKSNQTLNSTAAACKQSYVKAIIG